MQQATRFLLGTTALAGAMLASATVQANECVSDKLLSNVEGYISSARDDAGEARWQRALDTLNGNISWVDGVDHGDGSYTDGYWTGVTLAEASLNADLRKESRWVPIKTAIHCMLKAGTYGVAAEKAWYQTWGAWNSLSPADMKLVAGMNHELPEELQPSPGKYYDPIDAEPDYLRQGSNPHYKFTANLTEPVGLGGYKIDNAALAIEFDNSWFAELSYGAQKGVHNHAKFTHVWKDLDFSTGAVSASSLRSTRAPGNGVVPTGHSAANEIEDAKGAMLFGQLYKSASSAGYVTTNDGAVAQHNYRIVGGVVSEHMAARYETTDALIPSN